MSSFGWEACRSADGVSLDSGRRDLQAGFSMSILVFSSLDQVLWLDFAAEKLSLLICRTWRVWLSLAGYYGYRFGVAQPASSSASRWLGTVALNFTR